MSDQMLPPRPGPSPGASATPFQLGDPLREGLTADVEEMRACVRLAAPSFDRIEATWNFTVWLEIPSRAAMVRLLIPSASISRISSSRGVSTGARSRRSAARASAAPCSASG